MSVQDYLDCHYYTAEQLAECCDVSVATLETMIAQKLIPQPSYKVAGDILLSAAFGELEAQGAKAGSYFHPASQHWIARAQPLPKEQAAETLQKLFYANMAAELSHLNHRTYRTMAGHLPPDWKPELQAIGNLF
jgi:hypothetical protein